MEDFLKMNDEELRMMCAGSTCTPDGIRAQLKIFKCERLPLGLEFRAYARGRIPSRFWDWLWRSVGRWVMRKAGFEEVSP
jgi:hypothetical protein